MQEVRGSSPCATIDSLRFSRQRRNPVKGSVRGFAAPRFVQASTQRLGICLTASLLLTGCYHNHAVRYAVSDEIHTASLVDQVDGIVRPMGFAKWTEDGPSTTYVYTGRVVERGTEKVRDVARTHGVAKVIDPDRKSTMYEIPDNLPGLITVAVDRSEGWVVVKDHRNTDETDLVRQVKLAIESGLGDQYGPANVGSRRLWDLL